MIVEGPWSGTNPGGAKPVERRRQPRARGLLGGKLYYGSGFTMNCLIQNLSEGGAKIRFPDEQPAPDGFHLMVIKSGIAFNSHTIWRAPTHSGVRFLDAVDLNAPPPHALVMREIWMQLTPR